MDFLRTFFSGLSGMNGSGDTYEHPMASDFRRTENIRRQIYSIDSDSQERKIEEAMQLLAAAREQLSNEYAARALEDRKRLREKLKNAEQACDAAEKAYYDDTLGENATYLRDRFLDAKRRLERIKKELEDAPEKNREAFERDWEEIYNLAKAKFGANAAAGAEMRLDF